MDTRKLGNTIIEECEFEDDCWRYDPHNDLCSFCKYHKKCTCKNYLERGNDGNK